MKIATFIFRTLKQMDNRILILGLIVIIHSFLMLLSVIYPVLWALNKTNKYLDFIVFIVVSSFFIVQRCLLIDIYKYVQGDLPDNQIPDYAKDDVMLRYINKYIFSINKTDTTSERTDIIDNVIDTDKFNSEEIYKLYNKRIRIIVHNVVVASLIMIKYKYTKLIPLFIVWQLLLFPTVIAENV